jgi:hypothetical protein
MSIPHLHYVNPPISLRSCNLEGLLKYMMHQLSYCRVLVLPLAFKTGSQGIACGGCSVTINNSILDSAHFMNVSLSKLIFARDVMEQAVD